MKAILDLREGEESGISYEYFLFKGGEPHIKLGRLYPYRQIEQVIIKINLTSFEEIGKLLMATDALKRELIKVSNSPVLKLYIGYFPGARQDRVMVPGEPLSVKVYADLINSLKFDQVIILDPHSDVAPALLDNCIVGNNYSFIDEVLTHINGSPLIISPDAGANKKIAGLSSYLLSEGYPVKVIKCDKTRDTSSGKLTGFKVYSEKSLNNKPCLIVDDICDGGGTFLGLADALQEKGAGTLYLAVTHGIFSNGFKELNTKFKKIFTTNSFKNYDGTWQSDHKHYKGFKANIVQIKWN